MRSSTDVVCSSRKLSIIDDLCPEEVVLMSHVLAQQDTGENSTELEYSTFVRAFCRIADVWTQNKYLKLSVKVIPANVGYNLNPLF
jgi:hypothetical protein